MGKNQKKIKVNKQNISTVSIIESLEKLRDIEYVNNSEFFSGDFNRLIDRFKDTSFKLAVVGEFSSGKSTFLNALIGRDLLKHGRKETTATITEIYNDYSMGDEFLIDVNYTDGTVKKGLTVNDIEDVTATDSKQYAVADVIEKVSIRGKIIDNNANICFVDTPGLNGIADKHREKTIEQIKNSHACIYLIQVRGLGESDIEFLKYICKYQHNIIFVQNFIDELKALEGETPEQKIAAQKKIINEKVLNENNDIKYSIVGVSSRKALIANTPNYKDIDGRVLTEEEQKELYEESRFDDVLDCINRLIESNEKDKIQQRDTATIALALINQLKDLILLENDKIQKEWDNSTEGIRNQNYKNLLDVLEKNYSLYQKKLDDFIESETSEIRKQSKRSITMGIEEIEKSIREIISLINTIESFEKYVSDSLPDYIYSKILDLEDSLNNNLNIQFENLICTAISRIKQYTGSQATNINVSEIEIKAEKSEISTFEEEENELIKLKKDLYEKKREFDRSKKKAMMIAKKQEENNKAIAQIDGKISNNKRIKNKEINNLGEMPEAQKKSRTETEYYYRGGFGILDALFGPKKTTKIVDYWDYSLQNEWVQKKNDLEMKYKNAENSYKKQKRILEESKKQNAIELEHIERMEKSRIAELKSMESLLETKTENIRIQKEKAKQEYLRVAKQGIKDSVKHYFDENVTPALTDSFTESIAENKIRVESMIKSLFATTYNERTNAIKALIIGDDNRKDIVDLQKIKGVIEETKNKLEVFICQQ